MLKKHDMKISCHVPSAFSKRHYYNNSAVSSFSTLHREIQSIFTGKRILLKTMRTFRVESLDPFCIYCHYLFHGFWLFYLHVSKKLAFQLNLIEVDED